MANIVNVAHSIPLVKQSYLNLLSFGEGATSDDFKMTIEGWTDIHILIQATQLPPIAREPIEGFGPHGVQFTQMGRYKNIAEVPITFKEVLTGVIYQMVRDWVLNKDYLTVTLALISESAHTSNVFNTIVMYDTFLELEGVDLSVEDATLVKPAGTLHANWLDYLDPTGTVLDW